MDLEWNWDKNTKYLNEHLPADTLERKKYAEFLYEVCAARGEKSNLVVNINAEWGAGKTYFTKRLAESISSIHPTVYIDAWKEDFSDDPLLTVFSSIKEQLTGQSDKFTTLLNKTVENIGPLLKTATPIILEGIMKKYTGIETLSDLTKDLSGKLLELHSEKSTKIETIKKGISEWVSFIKQGDGIENKHLPLFIIIDELDRCRPNFAINLLEITKHIFNIPGVVFIIATDTEQLQHSIKVVYGNEFSASHYLNRFFDRRFLLPSPKLHQLLTTKSPDNIISEFSRYRELLNPTPPTFQIFIANCSSILESLKINLRDALKLYDRLIDTLVTSKKVFDPWLMLILLAINSKYYNEYTSIKNNTPLNIIPFPYHIHLTFNLSYSATGVQLLQKGNNTYENTYELKQYSGSIGDYYTTAIKILGIENTNGNNNNDTPYEWLNGSLSTDGSISNFIKMAYAWSKAKNKGLKLEHYFDLIELSTTFE
ncbi:KAP family NTPase [Enterobacter mori]|uniref:KAP family P-loop NTPase fold protein n=1 Tax=Enterobacter mori TaxID=539813 RepID=UPI001BE0461B|nr:P-loop NTPase fold protein [Enterobacter mori]MBT1869355.1 KAP family NTPase [Enterobacter mori]